MARFEKRLEMELVPGVWTDTGTDWIEEYSWSRGIMGGGFRDRVARAGTFEFVLNNGEHNSVGLAGYYAAGHANVRSGFEIGAPVRLVYVFEGIDKVEWTGKIVDAEPEPGLFGYRTFVTAKDLMHELSINKLVLPPLATNKTLAEVVDLVLANVLIQPEAKDYGTCERTFKTVFDTTRSEVLAATEIAKAALCEPGFVMVTQERGKGETLRVQGRETRAESTLRKIPVGVERSPRWVAEDGKQIITEVGMIVHADIVEEAGFVPMTITPRRGKELINRVRLTVNLRKIDDAPVVLFELESPVKVPPHETVEFTGSYRDPEQLAQRVSTKDMQAPVASVDYLMNSAADGSGVDMTGLLTVQAEYGTNEVKYRLSNSSAVAGYCTFLVARGYGIYIYRSVDVDAVDGESIAKYGLFEEGMDLAYLDEVEDGQALADALVAKGKDPLNSVEEAVFDATLFSQNVYAMLFMEPGDRIGVADGKSGITGDWFIQGVEARSSMGGEALEVTWRLMSEMMSTI